jgi:hypothetical protein
MLEHRGGRSRDQCGGHQRVEPRSRCHAASEDDHAKTVRIWSRDRLIRKTELASVARLISRGRTRHLPTDVAAAAIFLP